MNKLMNRFMFAIVLLLVVGGNVSAQSQFGTFTITRKGGVVIVDRVAEGITFQSRYTKEENFDAKVVESRSMIIELEVMENPDNKTIWINQMYAEATMVSNISCLDHQLIDTVNDKVEGGWDTAGWNINEHPYVEEWFISRFNNDEGQWGQEGYCEYSDKKVMNNYVGTILLVDYDMVIQVVGEKHPYKFSVIDRLVFDADGDLLEADDELEGGNVNASFPIVSMIMIGVVLVYFRRKRNND